MTARPSFRKFAGFDFGTDGKPVDGDRISRDQVSLDVNAIRTQAS